jgi:hypothetical protein
MKLRFAPATDLTNTGADQSFTLDVVAPLNTTDFHTSKDEGHLHHPELANLAAMARSIFHQVGATEGGGHTYADEETYTVGVTIKDVGGSTTSATSKANITDAALTATGTTISGTEGTAINGATVANFRRRLCGGRGQHHRRRCRH